MKFEMHNVRSDDAKFRHIATHLDGDLLDMVGDIIDHPPSTGKYDAIKQRIINTLSESQEVRLRRLLSEQPLGEDKPSTLLQRLRSLSAGQCNDKVLRSLFLEQLPESVRSVLVISECGDLTKLAEQADKIIEAIRPQIAAVATSANEVNAFVSSNTTSDCAIDDRQCLLDAIRSLTQQVTRLASQQHRGQRNRGRAMLSSQPHSRATSSALSANSSNRLCYYHRKFGTAAQRCRAPCTMSTQLN